MVKKKLLIIIIASVIAAAAVIGAVIAIVANSRTNDDTSEKTSAEQSSETIQTPESKDAMYNLYECLDRFSLADGFSASATASTKALGLERKLEYNRVFDGESTYQQMLSTSFYYDFGVEMFVANGGYGVRNALSVTDDVVEWGNDVNADETSFLAVYGYVPNGFSRFLINENTVLSGRFWTKIDGTYVYSYKFDCRYAAKYAAVEYKTQFGVSDLPLFTSIEMFLTFDEEWLPLEAEYDLTYTLDLFGGITCTEKLVESFSYGSKISASTAEHFSSALASQPVAISSPDANNAFITLTGALGAYVIGDNQLNFTINIIEEYLLDVGSYDAVLKAGKVYFTADGNYFALDAAELLSALNIPYFLSTGAIDLDAYDTAETRAAIRGLSLENDGDKIIVCNSDCRFELEKDDNGDLSVCDFYFKTTEYEIVSSSDKGIYDDGIDYIDVIDLEGMYSQTFVYAIESDGECSYLQFNLGEKSLKYESADVSIDYLDSYCRFRASERYFVSSNSLELFDVASSVGTSKYVLFPLIKALVSSGNSLSLSVASGSVTLSFGDGLSLVFAIDSERNSVSLLGGSIGVWGLNVQFERIESYNFTSFPDVAFYIDVSEYSEKLLSAVNGIFSSEHWRFETSGVVDDGETEYVFSAVGGAGYDQTGKTVYYADVSVTYGVEHKTVDFDCVYSDDRVYVSYNGFNFSISTDTLVEIADENLDLPENMGGSELLTAVMPALKMLLNVVGNGSSTSSSGGAQGGSSDGESENRHSVIVSIINSLTLDEVDGRINGSVENLVINGVTIDFKVSLFGSELPISDAVGSLDGYLNFDSADKLIKTVRNSLRWDSYALSGRISLTLLTDFEAAFNLKIDKINGCAYYSLKLARSYVPIIYNDFGGNAYIYFNDNDETVYYIVESYKTMGLFSQKKVVTKYVKTTKEAIRSDPEAFLYDIMQFNETFINSFNNDKQDFEDSSSGGSGSGSSGSGSGSSSGGSESGGETQPEKQEPFIMGYEYRENISTFKLTLNTGLYIAQLPITEISLRHDSDYLAAYCVAESDLFDAIAVKLTCTFDSYGVYGGADAEYASQQSNANYK